MKVAFVIPFAFERFFHDAKALFRIRNLKMRLLVRNTWHFNWAMFVTFRE